MYKWSIWFVQAVLWALVLVGDACSHNGRNLLIRDVLYVLLFTGLGLLQPRFARRGPKGERWFNIIALSLAALCLLTLVLLYK